MALNEALLEEDKIKEILHEFILKLNLKDVRVEIQNSNMGEGFLSVTNTIHLKTEDKTLKLFIKTAPKGEILRKALLTKLVFQKEIYFYDKILPIYENIVKIKTGKTLNLTPKCHAINSEELHETLIFEDLKDDGFLLLDKRKFFDKDHILLVLQSYAKLHGISYILKTQYPEKYKKLCAFITDDTLMIANNFNFFKNIENGLKLLNEHVINKVDINIINKIKALVGKNNDFFEEITKIDRKYGVILHGDGWQNNFMFKYKDDKKPSSVRLLDFQLHKINLPVIDLAFFFYCSAASPRNLEKLNYFLKFYHRTLFDFVKDLGSDLNEIYPYDVFMEHWKQFSKFGLFMSLIINKAVLCDDEELPNLKEIIKLGQNHEGVFDIKMANSDDYTERMKNIILHFVFNDCI